MEIEDLERTWRALLPRDVLVLRIAFHQGSASQMKLAGLLAVLKYAQWMSALTYFLLLYAEPAVRAERA